MEIPNLESAWSQFTATGKVGDYLNYCSAAKVPGDAAERLVQNHAPKSEGACAENPANRGER